MHVFLLGVSHHTAPVDLRERLDFSSRDVGEAVRALADMAVTNRTASGAEALAHAVGGRTVDWHDLAAAVAGVDIVVSATGAPRPVLTRDVVAGLTHSSQLRPFKTSGGRCGH